MDSIRHAVAGGDNSVTLTLLSTDEKARTLELGGPSEMFKGETIYPRPFMAPELEAMRQGALDRIAESIKAGLQ